MKNKWSAIWILLCVALCANAGPGTVMEKGFIRDWLISGPYPSYQVNGKGTALDTDFLNGEAEVKPYPGLRKKSTFLADKAKLIAGIGSTNEWGFTETKSFDADWKACSFSEDIIMLDKKFLPIDDYFAAYALCYLEVPDAVDAVFGVGSDDDHKLFLNGKMIGRQYSSQGVVPNNFCYPVRLEAGINRILLKVVDRIRGCGFCFSVADRSGKPIPGLKVHSDHPGRKLGYALYNNGCAATFQFAGSTLFEGKNKLKIEVYPSQKYEILFNGEKLLEREFDLNLKEGTHPLKLEFFEKGKRVSLLTDQVTVYSKVKLEQENRTLERQIASMKRTLPELEQLVKRLKEEVKSAEKSLNQTYDSLEKSYAQERAWNAGNAPKSIAEKLPPATLRSRLCINGEWEASTDRKNWHKVLLPLRMMNRFFLRGAFPVHPKNPKNVYGAYEVDKGYEDFSLSPVITAKRSFFRIPFQYDGTGSVVFVSEGIMGKAKFFCNGTLCGEYDGRIGILNIELKNLRKGKNVFELEFEVGRINTRYGILGDLYFDFVPSVRVADVYVKPSWRKAALDVSAELVNHIGVPVKAEIRQYAAREGIIHLKLPPVRTVIPSGKTAEVETRSGWADPLIWGIGGKYGNPDMYDLVTDVYLDGKLADRHIQPFGFREFWIHRTDFFLNGKRIILQGEVGNAGCNEFRFRDIVWPLYRYDNINILRYHDSDYWSATAARTTDRMGMLSYVQMYPELHEPGTKKPYAKNFSPLETWTETATHQWNLDNYRRWFRMFRNNPSVVIWSTDNEILTQAWDTVEKAPFNLRNDKIGAMYEKFMKTLDHDLVLTRNGDVGTQNSKGRWFENPPCDTANYHYPDFNIDRQVRNWQKVYEYRPVIFGETLYCSYGAWDNWIGAIPEQVLKKAQRVREVAGLYRHLGVPAQIYMGVGLDGFIIWDDSGKGNPWGITRSMMDEYDHRKILPPGRKADEYPKFRIPWPAYSGRGERKICISIAAKNYANTAYNWFDERYPSHIRNAVNDAYRETLIPQPPLRVGNDAECIVETAPGTDVWSVSATGERYGVRSDRNGKAWFQFDFPGIYTFTDGAASKTLRLGDRKGYVNKPGFGNIPHYRLRNEN